MHARTQQANVCKRRVAECRKWCCWTSGGRPGKPGRRRGAGCAPGTLSRFSADACRALNLRSPQPAWSCTARPGDQAYGHVMLLASACWGLHAPLLLFRVLTRSATLLLAHVAGQHSSRRLLLWSSTTAP